MDCPNPSRLWTITYILQGTDNMIFCVTQHTILSTMLNIRHVHKQITINICKTFAHMILIQNDKEIELIQK